MGYIELFQPLSSPFTLYPWPCRGGQTAAASSPCRVHAKDQDYRASQKHGMTSGRPQPCSGYFSHPLHTNTELTGRSPCWMVRALGRFHVYAACLLLHVGFMAPQQPHFNPASEAPSAERARRRFNTALWGRVTTEMTSCPLLQ